jgi:heat shock protein HtpX
MKRVILLVATNIAVMVVLSIVVSVLGLDRWLTANGLDYFSLLVMSAIFGFGGAFISLLMSKPMAKMAVGAQTIDGSEGSTQYWLVTTVHKLADAAGIGRPEVAVFEGAPNAFATGAFRDSSLVAVSTGLVETMSKEEVEAVLGHEVAHIANGDMVTLTLIQGVVNTFVIFLSRVVGFVVDRVVFKTERGHGPAFWITAIVAELVIGILASLLVFWFSRQREYRADAGGARLAGRERMIGALERLRPGYGAAPLPDQMAALGISGKTRQGLLRLFTTHPSIEERIERLRAGAGVR